MIGSEVFRTTTQSRGHPLGIPRVTLTVDLCRLLGWVDDANFIDSPCATKDDLADFHDMEYIDAVDAAETLGHIDPALGERYHIGVNGNPIFDGMYRRPATACGGGLLAEPMARLGADVTGIDASKAAIEAARAHAAFSGLEIDYHCKTAEALAAEGAQFDVIYASEVIEHVADRQLFASAIAQMLASGGTVVITTINRTLAALALAKFMLEYVVRMVPAGTHDPSKFVRPHELRAEFAAADIVLDDMTGFAPRPARRIGANGFMRVGSLAINYAASGTHA